MNDRKKLQRIAEITDADLEVGEKMRLISAELGDKYKFSKLGGEKKPTAPKPPNAKRYSGRYA